MSRRARANAVAASQSTSFSPMSSSVGTCIARSSASDNGFAAVRIVAFGMRKCFIRDASNQTLVPGLFGAGDVADGSVKQIIIATGDGVRAALTVDRYLAELGQNSAAAADAS